MDQNPQLKAKYWQNGIKKLDATLWCLQESHFTSQIRWKLKVLYTSCNLKGVGVSI